MKNNYDREKTQIFSSDFYDMIDVSIIERQFNFTTQKHMYNSIFLNIFMDKKNEKFIGDIQLITYIYGIIINLIYNYFMENKTYENISPEVYKFCVQDPFDYLKLSTYKNTDEEYFGALQSSYFRSLDILYMSILPFYVNYNINNLNITYEITYNMLNYASRKNKDVYMGVDRINMILFNTFIMTIAAFQCLQFPSTQKKYFSSSILNIVNYLAQFQLSTQDEERKYLMDKCYLYISQNKVYNFNYYVINIFNLLLIQNVYIFMFNGQIEQNEIIKFTDIISNILTAIMNDIGFISPYAIRTYDGKNVPVNGIFMDPKRSLSGVEIFLNILKNPNNEYLMINEYNIYRNDNIPFMEIKPENENINVNMKNIMSIIYNIQICMDYNFFKGREKILSNVVEDHISIFDITYQNFYVISNINDYDYFIYNNYTFKKILILNSLLLFGDINIYNKDSNNLFDVLKGNYTQTFYIPISLNIMDIYDDIINYNKSRIIQLGQKIKPDIRTKKAETKYNLPEPPNWWILPDPEEIEEEKIKQKTREDLETHIQQKSIVDEDELLYF